MAHENPAFHSLAKSYLFSTIEDRCAALGKRKDPILNLGIGDISQPLAPAIVSSICRAVKEMGKKEGIRGYGPSEGYPFLRKAIRDNEYRNCGIEWDEIFISDGANSDAVNIQDLFAAQNRFGILNPTYPAYLDASIIAGRLGQITEIPCLEKNGWNPEPPNQALDVVYLCSPNNPTGVALNRKGLTRWVDWARHHRAILIVDAAYSCFIRSQDVPQSIYEIPGANEVALELKTFSKSAGFTGLRCAYMVVPKQIELGNKRTSLHALWSRRQAVKSNGVSYPVQRGAEAVYAEKGKRETALQIGRYRKAAAILAQGLKKTGQQVFGGVDSPYIWWKTPKGMSSWDFFDHLLNRCGIVSVPGGGIWLSGRGLCAPLLFHLLRSGRRSDKALSKERGYLMMRFATDSEQKRTFQRQGYLELEEFCSSVELDKLQALYEKARNEQLKKMGRAGFQQLIDAGRSLALREPLLKQWIVNSSLGSIASELLREKEIRLGFDHYFVDIEGVESASLSHLTLKEQSSIQGLLGAAFINLSDAADPSLTLLPKQRGSCLFCLPIHSFDLLSFLQVKGLKLLMITFCRENSLYLFNPQDPYTHQIKKWGHNFGDLLTNQHHPFLRPSC